MGETAAAEEAARRVAELDLPTADIEIPVQALEDRYCGVLDDDDAAATMKLITIIIIILLS